MIASISSELMEKNVNFEGLIMRNFANLEDTLEWLKEQ